MKRHGLFKGENREKNKRIYSIWKNMKQRCYRTSNKDHEYYGGKGIKVCDEWKDSFFNFCQWAKQNGYAEHLTLDRIDPEGDYCPENCRWATTEEQNNNKSNSLFITIGNERLTAKQASEKYGINYYTLYYRIKHNWPVERLLQKVQ